MSGASGVRSGTVDSSSRDCRSAALSIKAAATLASVGGFGEHEKRRRLTREIVPADHDYFPTQYYFDGLMHHAEGKILFRKCTIADLKVRGS